MANIGKDIELDLDMITECEKQFEEDEILLMASQRFEAVGAGKS